MDPDLGEQPAQAGDNACHRQLISLYCRRPFSTLISWPEGDTMKGTGTGQTFLQVLLSLAFLLLAGISTYGQQKRVIAGPKGFPYSGGIVVGKTLYIAGQEAEDENGNLTVRGIEPETRGALENLAKVVKAAGFELKDVVSVTVYLADLKEFEAMNKVYRELMPDPKPTRATVQVVRLVNDARIEISAIAVKER